ncbi:MAG: YceD family protein [Gaiella sp.]
MTTYALRSLRLRPGEELREHVEIALEPFVLGGEAYLPVPAVTQADLTIQRTTSGDMFRLQFATRLHGPCMRCLGDAALDVVTDAHEYQDERPDDEEMSSEYVSDGQLDLSAWARDAVADALPDQIVCRPECAGLCPTCGRSLDDDPHEHEPDLQESPWSVLRALRDEIVEP